MGATGRKPLYADLEQRIRDLEKEARRLKRRNEALEKSNEEYRAFAQSQTVFICRFLPDGVLTFVNDSLAQHIGKRPEQLINQNLYHLLFAQDGDEVRGKMATLSPENPVVEIEHRMRSSNGEALWVRWFNNYLSGHNEPVGQILGVGRDVTELKRMQQSLDKSERRYKRLLETMNEGFCQVDEHLDVVYTNSRLCEMLGYEPEELIGQSVMRLFNDKNARILREQFRKRKKGEGASYQITAKKRNGEDLHVLVSPTPRFDEKRIFRGSHQVITDITRLKRAEQALRHRETVLNMKTAELAEANAALRVLIKTRDETLQEMKQEIVSTLKRMEKPYLNELRGMLGTKGRYWIMKIESSLDGMLSPQATNLASKYMDLTPTELQVATLVRDGNSSKEIAGLLNVSQRTVEFHRLNIRKKLGLQKINANLRTRLLSLQ
jgi:PAS domain S-box-containing protein